MKSLIVLMCLSLLNLAYASTKEFMVKTFAHPCHRAKESGLIGSGTLFSYQSKTIVLTSEHVTYPETKSVCYKAQLNSGKVKSARLLRRDWAQGMAILELDHSLPAMELTKIKKPSMGTIVRTLGFPYRSFSLVEDRGELISTTSKRHVIPELSQVLELQSAHGEFGMSGGAIFDEEDHYVGMISHQSIEILPGGASEIALNGIRESLKENIIIGINGKDIRSWLEEDEDPTFHQKYNDLKNKNSSIYYGNVRFALKGDIPEGAIGGDGVGVGGDGIGVGGDGIGVGGDGVGVGGENGQVLGNSVFLSLIDLNPPFKAPYPHLKEWWQKTMRSLTFEKSKEVQVFAFLKLSDEGATRTEFFFFKGLSQFVTLLRNSQFMPVTYNPLRSNSKNREWIKKLEAFEMRGAEGIILKEELLFILKLYGLSEGVEVHGLGLEKYTDLSRHPGWGDFLDADFEFSVEILRYLKELE